MAAESNNIEDILKPFYRRASEAEDRLARLEASLTRNKETGNDEQLKLVSELKSELEDVKAEQVAEREKATKEVEHLATENAKLQYRIIHLVRALKEADGKLAANEIIFDVAATQQTHRQVLEDMLSSGAGRAPDLVVPLIAMTGVGFVSRNAHFCKAWDGLPSRASSFLMSKHFFFSFVFLYFFVEIANFLAIGASLPYVIHPPKFTVTRIGVIQLFLEKKQETAESVFALLTEV
ncbi:hypothetical protein OROGR_016860 [Orobanche gracilis]